MGAELTALLDATVRTLDPDAELMLRFQAGDERGFEEIVERYRRPLLGFVFRLVRDAAASEELLQEAFLRVYQHRLRYRPQARFSTWIHQIAQNLAFNYIRDHRRDRMHDSLDEPLGEEGAARELADQRPTAEEALLEAGERAWRQRRVQAAIAALPERQQAAVILHKYQGMNYADIGAALRLSESATKSLLFRAYETLRRQLKDLL